MKFETYLNQDYDALKEKLLEEGTLFEDPEFPAEESSMFQCTKPMFSYLYNIFWKRPQELTETPKFIENGINPNDLYQGKLGKHV